MMLASWFAYIGMRRFPNMVGPPAPPVTGALLTEVTEPSARLNSARNMEIAAQLIQEVQQSWGRFLFYAR